MTDGISPLQSDPEPALIQITCADTKWHGDRPFFIDELERHEPRPGFPLDLWVTTGRHLGWRRATAEERAVEHLDVASGQMVRIQKIGVDGVSARRTTTRYSETGAEFVCPKCRYRVPVTWVNLNPILERLAEHGVSSISLQAVAARLR